MKNAKLAAGLLKHATGALILGLAAFTLSSCSDPLDSEFSEATPELALVGAPENIESITLTISGPGIKEITKTFPPTVNRLTTRIPAGRDRFIEIQLKTPSATLIGSAKLDLKPMSQETIRLDMSLYRTRLIMPDFQNRRVIQLDNMNGAGGKLLKGPKIGMTVANFRPYDIDYDNRGRIYIANLGSSTPYRRVLRVNNINGSGLHAYPTGPAPGIVCLTIDRENGILYMSNGSTLRRMPLDGSTSQGMTITAGVAAIGTIRGMSVDSKLGLLFIAGADNGLPTDMIFRYNISSQTVVDTVSANMDKPWDILIKGKYIFVTNRDGAPGKRLIRALKNFTSFTSAGYDASGGMDTSPGAMYGLRRFVAPLNDRITMIDDDPTADFDKLVMIDNIQGGHWKTFPANGTGQAKFKFYFKL